MLLAGPVEPMNLRIDILLLREAVEELIGWALQASEQNDNQRDSYGVRHERQNLYQASTLIMMMATRQ
jgi:hypothetical protein